MYNYLNCKSDVLIYSPSLYIRFLYIANIVRILCQNQRRKQPFSRRR